jgi:hypothetical protein
MDIRFADQRVEEGFNFDSTCDLKNNFFIVSQELIDLTQPPLSIDNSKYFIIENVDIVQTNVILGYAISLKSLTSSNNIKDNNYYIVDVNILTDSVLNESDIGIL